MKKLFLLFAITLSFGFISCSSDGEEIKVEASQGDIIIDGHRFVDLELPSGLLWAETNIGSVLTTYAGDYFTWGDTSPVKSDAFKDNYRFWWNDTITKYNKKDEKTVLEKEDDAAYVRWGHSCRIPTDKDFEELKNPNNCTWTWIKNKKISGYKIVSKKNGKYIFLPGAGARVNRSKDYEEERRCFYWTSIRHEVYQDRAIIFYTEQKNYEFKKSWIERFSGLSIRPVAEP